MKVRVEDEDAAEDLGEFLRVRIGAIVERSGPGELEVSLLGSYCQDALREELTTVVRRWAVSMKHPDAQID